MAIDIDLLESVFIEQHRFELLKNKKKGRMVLDIELNEGQGRRRMIKYSIQVISVWVEPESNNAVRAFCMVNKNSKRNLTLLNIIRKFSALRFRNTTKVISEFNGVVLYREKPGVTSECEDEDYNEHELFENKTTMMNSILDSVKVHRPVGGFEFCNLNMIPDQLFLSFGFTKIEDYFSKLPAMWKAKISSLLNPEQSGSYYRSDAVKRRGELLLKIIQAILEGKDIKEIIEKEKNKNA